jgi:hypothetical protein
LAQAISAAGEEAREAQKALEKAIDAAWALAEAVGRIAFKKTGYSLNYTL